MFNFSAARESAEEFRKTETLKLPSSGCYTTKTTTHSNLYYRLLIDVLICVTRFLTTNRQFGLLASSLFCSFLRYGMLNVCLERGCVVMKNRHKEPNKEEAAPSSSKFNPNFDE